MSRFVGQLEASALKALESMAQHRAVDLVQNIGSDLDDVVWPDAKDVCIKRGVMQPAQGNAIRNTLAAPVRETPADAGEP